MGERCARDQKQLVAGEIGLVQLGAVDVQIRAVCSVHQVAAPVRQNFTHGHPGTNAGASQRDMGDIHPLFCQIAGNKSSKLVIRNFTDVSDRKAEPGLATAVLAGEPPTYLWKVTASSMGPISLA